MWHRFLTGIALAGLLCTSAVSPVDAVVPVSSIPSVATTATHLSVTTAATVKPRANLAAERQDLPSGKVLVSVTSNAKKVKLTYRSAKNTKRTTNIKIRKGVGKATLAKEMKKIYAQAAATSKLRRSLKIPVLPPLPTPAPATSPPPVAAPAPTPPVATPPPVNPAPVDAPPGQVIGLTATALSPWSIRLSWTNPPDADLEWVEIRSDGDWWWMDIEDTTYTDRYLQPGTTHTYTLRAYDTAENTGPPVSVSATTWRKLPSSGPRRARSGSRPPARRPRPTKVPTARSGRRTAPSWRSSRGPRTSSRATRTSAPTCS